jgi:hypothetical protein
LLSLALALLVVVAVSAVLYLKYPLDNTPDNKDLEAAMSATFKKMHESQRGGDTGIGWMEPPFSNRLLTIRSKGALG